MKLIFLLILFLKTTFALDYGKWHFHGYGPGGMKDEADGVSIDRFGNRYIGGGFSNTVLFYGEKLTSIGKRDIFIHKINRKGKVIWRKIVATKNDENIFDLTHDNDGNIIVSGYQEQLVGRKLKHVAVFIKINGNDGSIIWKKSIKTNGVASGGNEITTDSKGNIYATMIAVGEVVINKKKYSGGGNKDSYLIKLDKNGTVKWVVNSDSPGSERIRAVAVGYNDQRIIIGFEYRGAIRINGTEFKSSKKDKQMKGAFALINSKGKVIKFQNIRNSSLSNIRASGGFDDGLYIHGIFRDKAIIDDISFSSPGKRSSFLIKLNKKGKIVWTRTIGNYEDESGGELAVNSKGDVFLTGGFKGKDYSIYDEKNISQKVFRDQKGFRSAYVLQISKDGNLIDRYKMNTTDSFSETGVIEVNQKEIVAGIRFRIRISVDGIVYETFRDRDKDFLILNLEY